MKGKPGAGKSTMMKNMISQIQSQEHENKPLILRFFFNGRSPSRLEVTMQGLFQSLICQFLQQDRHLLQTFLPLYRRKINMHGTDWVWHAEELKEVFRDICLHQCRSPLLVVLDALDECDAGDVREIVEFFQDLLRSPALEVAVIRVCLSSRYYPTIHVESYLEIHLDKHNKPDIIRYIERWL